MHLFFSSHNLVIFYIIFGAILSRCLVCPLGVPPAVQCPIDLTLEQVITSEGLKTTAAEMQKTTALREAIKKNL